MARRIMLILWPSFLVAIVAEGFFFSMVDPHEITLFGTHGEVTRLASYTIGFFFFWVFCALASGLTCYLSGMPEDRNTPR